VHGVCCEPGGDKRVVERLRERNCDPTFPIHSDPSKALLPCPVEKAVVLAQEKASQYGGDYEDYEMVQPALFVLGPDLDVRLWWSWHKAPDFDPANPGGGWDLIRRRPVSEDILPALKEGREVRLEDLMGPTPPM